MSGSLSVANPYEKGWAETMRSGAYADVEISTATDRILCATKDTSTFHVMFGPVALGSGSTGAGTPSETSPGIPAWRAHRGIAYSSGSCPRVVTTLIRAVAEGTTMLIDIVPASGSTAEYHRIYLLDGVSGQKVKVYPADPETPFAGGKSSPQEITGTGDWYVECRPFLEDGEDTISITTPAAVPSTGPIALLVANAKGRAAAMYLRA